MINKSIEEISAPFTPMDEKGEINPSAITYYAQKIKKRRAFRGFYMWNNRRGNVDDIGGTKKGLRRMGKISKRGDFKIIVHVGTTSLKQSQELAKHAQQIGAYGSSTMGPMFLKPTNVEPLVDFVPQVASAAPDIPFLLSYSPDFWGCGINEEFFRNSQNKDSKSCWYQIH